MEIVLGVGLGIGIFSSLLVNTRMQREPWWDYVSRSQHYGFSKYTHLFKYKED